MPKWNRTLEPHHFPLGRDMYFYVQGWDRMCVWLGTYMHVGTHFPLGSTQGLVCKFCSLMSSKWWHLLPKRHQLLLGHLLCKVPQSPLPSHQQCWGSGTLKHAGPGGAAKIVPNVFRQATWAMAWLPCRLKGDLAALLGKTAECPFCTGADSQCFTHTANSTRLAEVFNATCMILFFWQKSFMEIAFPRVLPRYSTRVQGGKHILWCWTSGLYSAMDWKCPVSLLLQGFKLN